MASANLGSALGPIFRLFGEGTLAGLSDACLLERYASLGDELAFQVLVRRHGPMVLAVCRGVLSDPNDGDDAFQATFLLLARKARSLWVDDSLGGWLHRVAWRIALQLKAGAARRRQRERRAAALAGVPVRSGSDRDDVGMVIHQEIDRLPERFRRPIVLCYLEDMTYQQAASHLRWSEGTTRGRLARGRKLLRARLSRRGVSLAVAAAAGALPETASAISPPLFRAAVRAARQIAIGETAAVDTVSSATTILVKEALRSMMIARLKIAATAALLVGTLTWVATGLSAMGSGSRDEPSPSGSSAIVADGRVGPGKPTEVVEEMVAFRGRVLGPDEKPAAGAALYTVGAGSGGPAGPVLRTQAGVDGTFRFTMTKEDFDAAVGGSPWAALVVLARARGLGPDWVELREPSDDELSLRLVDDSVPISGRILDFQGKPVVGAKVTRGRIMGEGAGGIDIYLKLVREDAFAASNHNFAKNLWNERGLPGQPASVTTDADGRFHLIGIGRDRIVEIAIEGPTIQSATIRAMTRGAAAVSSPRDAFAPETIYGATFDHLIPPGRSLTGVVRDKRSKQPLAGVEVCGQGTNSRVSTDVNGQFTLPGFPKGKNYALMVLAGEKRAPYFVTCLRLPDTAGLAPIRADVDCVPGIPLRLRLIDKETGKPVENADVFYEPIYPNPQVREVSGYSPVNGSGPYNRGIRQDDGDYLLGVLPGPGGVFVRTAAGKYRPACVDPRRFFGAEEAKDSKGRQDMLYGDRNSIATAVGDGFGGMPQEQFSAIVLVNPAEGSGPLTAEAVLERDPKREVRVIGPDGAPLAGVTAEGEGAEATRTTGVLTVSRLNPLRPKRFLFRHSARKLVGFLLARGDEAERYRVTLQPWGTIVGRLVDDQGKPRPRVDLMTTDWQSALNDHARGILPGALKTDDEGRFRVEGLVPGQEYSGNAVGDQAAKGGFGVVIDRVVLEPGQTRELGDVRSRASNPAPD